ncbi:MAG: site-2 protease family protein [Clostridiales bacterium]|jgi:regulator of sigma E protease|nr:site-2 protease family protein [Clostridiales bacterium]
MEIFLNILRIAGYLFLAFVCLSVMVVLHELGHFIAGRKLGFKINEFAVGMGPKIISRKLKSGLILSWRLIPIGGFCAFEEEDEDVPPPPGDKTKDGKNSLPASGIENTVKNSASAGGAGNNAKDSLPSSGVGNTVKNSVSDGVKTPSPDGFNSHKPWKRLVVLAAGVVTNFVSAIIVLSLFFTFSGQTLPYIAPTAGGNAAEFGVELGDVVTKVDGKSFQMLEPADFTGLLKGRDTVKLTVLRKGEEREITLERHIIYEVERDEQGKILYDENGGAVIKTDENGDRIPIFETDEEGNPVLGGDGKPKPAKMFGIQVGQTKQTFGFFESVYRAVRFSFFTAVKILSSLGSLITGGANVAETAGGPITMIEGLTKIVSTGWENTVYIVCLFSVNLAIFNILPLPALDGGRIVFTVIEWIRKKPINRRVEGMIHFIGIVALFGLAILFDIIHFINLFLTR